VSWPAQSPVYAGDFVSLSIDGQEVAATAGPTNRPYVVIRTFSGEPPAKPAKPAKPPTPDLMKLVAAKMQINLERELDRQAADRLKWAGWSAQRVPTRLPLSYTYVTQRLAPPPPAPPRFILPQWAAL
jgi:hypothetical protein